MPSASCSSAGSPSAAAANPADLPSVVHVGSRSPKRQPEDPPRAGQLEPQHDGAPAVAPPVREGLFWRGEGRDRVQHETGSWDQELEEEEEEPEKEEEEELDLNAVTLPERALPKRRAAAIRDTSPPPPPPEAGDSPSSARTTATSTTTSSPSSSSGGPAGPSPSRARPQDDSQQQLYSARSSVLQWAISLMSPRKSQPLVAPPSVALTNTPTAAQTIGSEPTSAFHGASSSSEGLDGMVVRTTCMELSHEDSNFHSASPSSTPAEPSTSFGRPITPRSCSAGSSPVSQTSAIGRSDKNDEEAAVERLLVRRSQEAEQCAPEDTASRRNASAEQTTPAKREVNISPAVASLREHIAQHADVTTTTKQNLRHSTLDSRTSPKVHGAPRTSPPRAVANRRISLAPRNSHRATSPFSRAQPQGQPSDVSEFDPLSFVIPQDWMIGFDSPKSQTDSPQLNAGTNVTGSAEAHKNLKTPLHRVGSSVPQHSLLDTIENEYSSPGSTIKYSVREYELLLSEIAKRIRDNEELTEQLEMLRSELKRKREEEEKTKVVLDEYEKTVRSLMDSAKREKERHALQVRLIAEERDRARDQVEMVERSFIDLRNRYDELAHESTKESEQQTSTIDQLRRDVIIAEQRYNMLLAHAEDKMASANSEIAKVRSDNDKEITALKAKLSRTDLQVRTLEATVAAKTKENAELVSICDTLMAKMEGSA